MSPVSPPEREIALYEALIATHPEIDQKGKSSPYTSINGNMFTILSANGVLGMRLGVADREAFMETFGTGLYEAHGTVMKEYVAVPAELLAETESWLPIWPRATTTRKASSPNRQHVSPEPARSRMQC
jgi:hypothetical protein